MRIIRKPQIERDQRKIRSGFAAGYKKGYEEGTKTLESMRREYDAQILSFQIQLAAAQRECKVSYVGNTTDASTRYTIYTTY